MVGCVRSEDSDQSRGAPGSPSGSHHRAMAGWLQNTKGLKMPHLLAPGDGDEAWGGWGTPEATVSPQNRLSHMKQRVKSFLFYFYCGICPGKEHLVWEKKALWSSLAGDERGSGPGRLSGMLFTGSMASPAARSTRDQKPHYHPFLLSS